MKTCGHCAGSMEGKRSNAVYCSRTCKTKSSDQRRNKDGRAVTRDRERYAKEGEHRRAYARKYHLTHPDTSKRARAGRRARQRQAVNHRFTQRDWNRLVARWRGCCYMCGLSSNELQREHVVPLARGGSHGAGNILPACPTCNYHKSTKFLSELRRGGGHAQPTQRSAP